jgi:hypothetical protein
LKVVVHTPLRIDLRGDTTTLRTPLKYVERNPLSRSRYICTRAQSFGIVESFQPHLFTEENTEPLQNVLIQQISFPTEVKKNEYLADLWSTDIPPDKWWRALKKIESPNTLSPLWLSEASEPSVIAMAQLLVGRSFRVTGVRLIRYTSLTTHKAIIRVMVVGIGESRRTTYSHNDGPVVWREGDGSCAIEDCDWLGRVG